MENINIFLSFTWYSIPTSCENINLFQNDFYEVIFEQNIVFVYAMLIVSTSKLLVISPNYVNSMAETLGDFMFR